mmetsp:Transcript_9785/g.32629  ORF Transcript_9785/g.32629 Transcript_9785/m.32629 type:complete len:99 (-) Transcript_9785:1008-1304(-)
MQALRHKSDAFCRTARWTQAAPPQPANKNKRKGRCGRCGLTTALRHQRSGAQRKRHHNSGAARVASRVQSSAPQAKSKRRAVAWAAVHGSPEGHSWRK